MDLTIKRLIIPIVYGVFIAPFVFAQHAHGVVVDQHKNPLSGVVIQCEKTLTQSNENGYFQLPCSSTVYRVYGDGIDTLVIRLNGIIAPPDTIVVTSNIKAIDGVEIIRKRLLYFDIGYLPPIRGVQIATGTNMLIQTERQGGAKSSGNPRELFAKVPGLNIWESDGAGIQMGVGGRGLSPNRAANFNTRQNGYDISADALGYPESYYTPPLEALSAIEIIRGSASLQYGTQFGGLMNFVIKDPQKNTPLEITNRSTIGNYGYFGNFTRISGTSKRLEYQAYYQLKTGNGYRPNSDFVQHQGFAQLGYYITEKQRVRLEYTRMSYLAKQPGGLTDYQFNENPLQSVRERNWFKVNWNILALHYDWEIRKNTRFNIRTFGMLSERLALGFLGKISQADPGGNRELIKGTFKNAGIEARLLHEYHLGTSIKGGVLLGCRAYAGQTISIQGSAPGGNTADFRLNNPTDVENSYYSFPSKNAAFFIENIWFFGRRWTVNAGARMEYIASSATGFYKQYVIHPLNFDTISITKVSDNHSLTRFVPLAGIGGSYKTGKKSTIYTNFCMNYRAVNFNDIRISNPNVVVDTLIRDEFGSTTELGWRGFPSSYLYADVALFYLFYGNKIGLAPEPDGVKKIRTNIGDAVNMGVELFLEWDFIKTWNDSARTSATIFLNFSYINAQYVRSKEANYIGKKVEYVSPVLMRSGLKIRNEKWQIQVQGSWNSAQFSDASNAIEASGDAVIGKIPSYFVMDFSARYVLPKGFQVEAGITNLLNNQYYTRRATAYPGPGILPADGITFYGTLQYCFSVKK